MHKNSVGYAALLHLLPEDLVLDVGSNVGHVTRVLAGVAGHVYAFEPNSELTSHYLDMPSNVTLIQKAVSNQIGETVLYVDAREGLGSVGSSLIQLAGMEGLTRSVPVSTITIDAFCDDLEALPDLIKIDVEGFEPEVIEGCQRTIHARSPVIIFELWESHWDQMLPTIQFMSIYYRLVRLSDGSDATSFYSTHKGVDVEDILCIPLAPKRCANRAFGRELRHRRSS